MPRRARIAPGGWIFHVLNRANGRAKLFESDDCYREFLWLLDECARTDAMRILAFCAMPNHWHLLLWPREDGDLHRFVHRLTLRHTKRWHWRKGTTGRGHLYQSRYKSFAVQDDAHLLTVCRYIERNPLRAGLVGDALGWPWSSTSARAGFRESAVAGYARVPADPHVKLDALPIDTPADWWTALRDPQEDAEVESLRTSVSTGVPFGSESWTSAAAAELELPAEARGRGRPRKPASASESRRVHRRKA